MKKMLLDWIDYCLVWVIILLYPIEVYVHSVPSLDNAIRMWGFVTHNFLEMFGFLLIGVFFGRKFNVKLGTSLMLMVYLGEVFLMGFFVSYSLIIIMGNCFLLSLPMFIGFYLYRGFK